MEKRQEKQQQQYLRWQPLLLLSGLGVLLWLGRSALQAFVIQLGAAALLMLLCLPLCRLLERRLTPSLAAALSLLGLGAASVLLALLITPPLVKQIRQLTEAIPALLQWGQHQYTRFSGWLSDHGFSLSSVWSGVFTRLGESAGDMVSALAGMITTAVQGLSKVLLSPLIAFYFLRDRAKIASWLSLLLPVRCRARAVRSVREMRRETAGFLRGQLLLSLAVGALTALALLLTGTPGWLLLGALMGIMELIPYLGPLLAGVPAVLLALQGGWIRALWTLAALLAVQQAETTLLSPRLLSGATQLHPLVVLLSISAGGMLFGTPGMLLAVPVVVSLRGAVRGWR